MAIAAGPWTLTTDGRVLGPARADGTRPQVGRLVGFAPDTARAVAQTPALLHALEHALAELLWCREEVHVDSLTDLNETIGIVRAALARARGTAPNPKEGGDE